MRLKLFLLLLLSAAMSITAQTSTVTGMVVNSNSGSPVNGATVSILDKAADKSRGRLKKKLPSLRLTGYDIRRDYWELEAHGDFNPFDFQIVNLKADYIERQARRFGYTQHADRETIMKRLEEGDRETADFVSALLTINKKKR